MGWGCVKCRRCDFVEVFPVATISFAFSLDWHGRSMQGSFSVMYGQAMKRWVKLCLSVFLHLGVSCPIFCNLCFFWVVHQIPFRSLLVFVVTPNRSVAWQETLALVGGLGLWVVPQGGRWRDRSLPRSLPQKIIWQGPLISLPIFTAENVNTVSYKMECGPFLNIAKSTCESHFVVEDVIL